MSQQSGPLYDVFISYSLTDQAWVRDWLLPRLESTGLRVAVDFRDFVVGMPRIENIERAIENSRRTIVVLTPEWIDSEWNAFEALLLRTTDPAARRRRLLPLLLKPCELPEAIASLEAADFAVERHWERQCRRLVRDIQDVIPVPAPWTEDGIRDVRRWKRWLRRYRRELIRGLVAIVMIWLVFSLALQLPPFQPRRGWHALGLHVSGAQHLIRFGDTLLASTDTDPGSCDGVDTGLWRSQDQGEHWEPINLPTKVQDPFKGCYLAAITAFAIPVTVPPIIYASTTDVGLLRGDARAEKWSRIGDHTVLPAKLTKVAIAPDDPGRIFARGWEGGLYRSTDGGEEWERIDGADTCKQTAEGQVNLPLSEASRGGILHIAADALYIGNDVRLLSISPSSGAGLYVSRDGGDCWRRLDDAEGRYSYLDLAEVPGTPAELLGLTFDHVKARTVLWQLDAERGRTRPLWETENSVGALYVDATTPPTWYVATQQGEVVSGTLDQPDRVQMLPQITDCVISRFCYADLAKDFESGVPLLLTSDRVFRFTQVPWLQTLWP